MNDFDYQWKHIPCIHTEFTLERVTELLYHTDLVPEFFKDKKCLDAGCGNGRWTYALQQLGAEVWSVDISSEAVESTKKINPDHTWKQDLLSLPPNPVYDFVLSWGVLHHTSDPRRAFRCVASQVGNGGMLHVMLYHRDTQKHLKIPRKLWKIIPSLLKPPICKTLAIFTSTTHGWYDALNPRYNFSYTPEEIWAWFDEEGFEKIRLVHERNIQMQGYRVW